MKVRLSNRSSVADVSKLMSGQVFAQAIGFAATPFIARLYSPDVMGRYAAIIAVANIVTPIVCLRYEQGIIQKSDRAEALALQVACQYIAGAISLVLLSVVAAFGGLRGEYQEEYAAWLLMPLLVLLSGVHASLTTTQISYGQFGRASVLKSAVSVWGQALKIGLAYGVAASTTSLVASHVVATAAAMVVGFSMLRRHGLLGLSWRIPRARVIDAMRRHSRFPKYNSVSTLLGSLSSHAFVPLMALFYSPAGIGNLVMVRALVFLPVALMGGAVGDVVYQRCATTGFSSAPTARRIASTVLLYMVPLAVFPFAFLGYNADWIFPAILGNDWTGAGVIATILCPYGYVLFVTSTVGTLFLVLGLQRQHMQMTLWLVVVQVFGIALASHTGFLQSLRVYVLATCTVILAGYGWLMVKVGVELRPLLYVFARAFAASFAVIVVTHFTCGGRVIEAAGQLILGAVYSTAEFIWARRALSKRAANGVQA